MQILQPPDWAKPKGYSNGIVATGRTVFLAGQFGCNSEGKFDTGDFAGQARQSLKNIVAILAEAGAGPQHICRLNWYVADRKEYIGSLREVGAAYREIIGKHYPVMTALEVGGFMDDGARLEIEVTAMIPGLKGAHGKDIQEDRHGALGGLRCRGHRLLPEVLRHDQRPDRGLVPGGTGHHLRGTDARAPPGISHRPRPLRFPDSVPVRGGDRAVPVRGLARAQFARAGFQRPGGGEAVSARRAYAGHDVPGHLQRGAHTG